MKIIQQDFLTSQKFTGERKAVAYCTTTNML